MQAAKQTITFRVKAETRDRLDKVADAMGRDHSYVLNQAIETYLEIHGWQVAHIEEGHKQARNGEFVPKARVALGFRSKSIIHITRRWSRYHS